MLDEWHIDFPYSEQYIGHLIFFFLFFLWEQNELEFDLIIKILQFLKA